MSYQLVGCQKGYRQAATPLLTYGARNPRADPVANTNNRNSETQTETQQIRHITLERTLIGMPSLYRMSHCSCRRCDMIFLQVRRLAADHEGNISIDRNEWLTGVIIIIIIIPNLYSAYYRKKNIGATVKKIKNKSHTLAKYIISYALNY